MWNKGVGKYPLKTYSIWWFILDLFLQGLIVSPALCCNDILPNNTLPLFAITGYTGLLHLETVRPETAKIERKPVLTGRL